VGGAETPEGATNGAKGLYVARSRAVDYRAHTGARGLARRMSTPTDFRDMTCALYAVVSAPPGRRDWASIAHYYHPDARLVRTGVNPDGSPFALVMSFDAYVQNVETLLKEIRFSEVELAHEAVLFGNVARLTSVYEYTRETSTGAHKGRGVNFFTLICQDGRWRIMSIVWDNERPGLSLPPSLL
jgi:hypothetical protein